MKIFIFGATVPFCIQYGNHIKLWKSFIQVICKIIETKINISVLCTLIKHGESY